MTPTNNAIHSLCQDSETRCECGQLIAKVRGQGLELKCKRCKTHCRHPFQSKDGARCQHESIHERRPRHRTISRASTPSQAFITDQRPLSPESCTITLLADGGSPKRFGQLGALVLASLPGDAGVGRKHDPGGDQSWLTKRLKSDCRSMNVAKGAGDHRETVGTPGNEPGIGSLPEVGKNVEPRTQAALSFGSTGSGRLVLCPVCLAAESDRRWVHGHTVPFTPEMAFLNQAWEAGPPTDLINKRFVPFIYADITEHVKFALGNRAWHFERCDAGGRNRSGVRPHRLFGQRTVQPSRRHSFWFRSGSSTCCTIRRSTISPTDRSSVVW